MNEKLVKNKLKSILLFSLLMFFCRTAMGAETINVATAGTLEASIVAQASVDKTAIAEIIITGNLNNTDIALLKTLSTSNSLRKIDLSGVTLASNALATAAFESSKLTSIKLPSSLATMGVRCFNNCSSLASVSIPTTNLTLIPEKAFTWNSALTEIVIPEGVTSIGANAFTFCGALKKLTLPSTLTHIGDGAFLGKVNTNFNIPIPLQEVHANMTTPPSMDGHGFCLGVSSDVLWTTCKLYVPSGSLATYRANVYTAGYGYGFGKVVNIIEPTPDYGMQTPVVLSPAPAGYDYTTDKLAFTLSEGIAMTPRGRIWANWICGGDSPEAFSVLNWSDDGGLTWTQPKVVIDPHDAALPEARRSLVSNIWTDPNGKLWFFFDYSMAFFDGRGGVWATVCENPDAENPTWSTPQRIWHGAAINKPIVLSSGEWVLPVSLWPRTKISSTYQTAYPELDADRKSHALVSTDGGLTWEKRGGVLFPHQDFDETSITEKNNGDLWMTARTEEGIFQSISTDKGYTWSVPTQYMKSAIARHFITRLASGNLLLVKNGRIGYDDARTNMTAYLSDDDGLTWKSKLLLDERQNVTYPDGFQAPDGTIYVAYDIRGIIYHIAAFTESDILAGEFLSPKSRQKGIIAPVLDDVATVNVSTPGGLQTALNALPINVNFLRDVTITGSLNDADIALLKTMSTGEHKLRIIDLSGATLANDALPASAFYQSSIEVIKLPTSLKIMGEKCFDNCMRLQTIDIPTTDLEAIPNNAFTWCKYLKSVEIPEGVKTIGANAFTFCGLLEELTLPSTLTHIGDGAFLGKVNETFSIPIPLKVINAKMTTVPTMDGHGICLGVASDPLWSSCVLNVPEGTLSAYRANVFTGGFGYGFGKILNIVETDFTVSLTEDNYNSQIKVYSQSQNQIVVEGVSSNTVANIYDAKGSLVKVVEINADKEIITSESGFYIVKVGTASFKVVL